MLYEQEIELDKATIYRQGAFGGHYRTTEVRNLKVRFVSFAQYEHAIEVTFIPKGKRKTRQFVETYRPTLVIAKGWDLAPAPRFERVVRKGDLIITMDKNDATMNDPVHNKRFKEWLWDNEYNIPVVANFHSYNPMNGKKNASFIRTEML